MGCVVLCETNLLGESYVGPGTAHSPSVDLASSVRLGEKIWVSDHLPTVILFILISYITSSHCATSSHRAPRSYSSHSADDERSSIDERLSDSERSSVDDHGSRQRRRRSVPKWLDPTITDPRSLGREQAGLSASDRFQTGVRPVPCRMHSPCHRVMSDAQS